VLLLEPVLLGEQGDYAVRSIATSWGLDAQVVVQTRSISPAEETATASARSPPRDRVYPEDVAFL